MSCDSSSFTTLAPIGMFHCREEWPYDVPRQGILAGENPGVIQLNSRQNFEQALQGLDSFDRIWLLFLFDRNSHWQPMVRPPRHRDKKVGVFATRAPYRPNPIGLSCVRLLAVRKLQLFVAGHDLLDNTPILDIKPYLPYADAFPLASPGWTAEEDIPENPVLLSPAAETELEWLEQHADTCIRAFLQNHLSFAPLDTGRHRLYPGPAGETLLAYRTWRIQFHLENGTARVSHIISGYPREELQNADDPYRDKALHRAFLQAFPCSN